MVFFLSWVELNSQRNNNDTWHTGEVVIKGKDTLKGLIKYSFRENQVVYKNNKEQRILLPGKFTSLNYIDTYDSSRHHFMVYNVKTARDYERPYFFEPVDTSGRIKLVKQFYWVERATNFGGSSYFADVRTVKQTVLYYFKNDYPVKQLKLRKREILRILKDKKHLIKEYVAENNLKYTTHRSVKKIIQYYNSLPI